MGHVTKAEKRSIASVEVVGPVAVPALPEGMHDTAIHWYESLKDSGQATYFEPSDWAAAIYVAEAMTASLGGMFSGQLFASVWSAMESLLTTEASRRRVRVEVTRVLSKSETGPTAIDDYRKRMKA